MADPSNELSARLTRYVTARKLQLKHSLGFGKDGTVFSTTTGTAVKVFQSREPYTSERDCYIRLAEHGVVEVLGHQVPEMIAWSDLLLVIEMSMVSPPYILDFASARLDHAPDFPPEVLEQWEMDRLEEFGANWSRVRLIIEFMREQYDIHLTDVHPRNITFAP